MKQYPSMDFKINSKVEIYAYNKLDGSNIRAEWSAKRGFYKFGTRKRLIDVTDHHLGKSVALIQRDMSKQLHKIFKRQKLQREVVCFFEFWGQHSFAGQHRKDDDHKVTLFDISIHKKGFITPKEFEKFFRGKVEIPDLLYRGRANKSFIESVHKSELEGMTFEGVVCKAPNPRGKKTGQRVCFKIKSQIWLNKLKDYCGDDCKKFEMMK